MLDRLQISWRDAVIAEKVPVVRTTMPYTRQWSKAALETYARFTVARGLAPRPC